MIWLFLFRIFNCLVVRSYFSPDEYWQSLEVAHELVFGYGELTWEWTNSSIRSIIHPMIFAVPYYLLKAFSLDYPWAVAYLPRILQGTLLYVTEILIHKSCGKSSLLLTVGSWFMFYAGVRTYSNSTELFFNALGLYMYTQNKINLWNVVIGISCMVRPTAVIVWVPVYMFNIYTRGVKFVISTATIW